MLTVVGEQVECLWDEVLPAEVRQLPDDLARLDRVLSDSLLLFPIAQAWEQGARERGRPSIPMATFVRLMVVKQRTGWGYETLVREVSDSLHLAAVLSDRDRSASAGRVDSPQARPPARRRCGSGDHQDGAREGPTRDTVHSAGGEDRLDGGRGRHPLPVRRDARPAGSQGTRARGQQAHGADRRQG